MRPRPRPPLRLPVPPGRWLALLAVSLAAAMAGCAHEVSAPDLGGIYDRSAKYHGADRNPVIVIPGILGSRLVQEGTGRIVWGSFTGDYANPEKPDGARLLALPMRDGAPLDALRDDVVPKGVLDRVRVSVFGLPIEQNAYLQILGTLGAGGYRDAGLHTIDYGKDHFTCFQFAYDWRRDNAENASRLDAFIREKRAYVQGEIRRRFGVTNADVKFDVVAHSMGGLLTRYYLMHGAADLPANGSLPPVTWAGARHVERAVLVGTPNAGSAEAFVQLVEGAKFSRILPTYPPAVLGTMPSIYELLPRSRHHAVVEAATGKPIPDLLDPALWERMGWGLASPAQDRVLKMLLPDVPDGAARRRIALDEQRKALARARQFTAAIDRPATPPPGLTLDLIAGDAVPTPAVIEVREDGHLRVRDRAPGDGRVLRSSALLDERAGNPWKPALDSPVHWSHVMFLFTDHLSMTHDPAFTDNLLYLLLEDPRR